MGYSWVFIDITIIIASICWISLVCSQKNDHYVDNHWSTSPIITKQVLSCCTLMNRSINSLFSPVNQFSIDGLQVIGEYRHTRLCASMQRGTLQHWTTTTTTHIWQQKDSTKNLQQSQPTHREQQAYKDLRARTTNPRQSISDQKTLVIRHGFWLGRNLHSTNSTTCSFVAPNRSALSR